MTSRFSATGWTSAMTAELDERPGINGSNNWVPSLKTTTTIAAPTIAPMLFPEPPMKTHESATIVSPMLHPEGANAPTYTMVRIPSAAEITPPITWALSFVLNTLMPYALAASSSSRIARICRPKPDRRNIEQNAATIPTTAKTTKTNMTP